MPFRDYPEYLRDIADSISNIENFIGEMSLEQVRADRKTEAAVERELQIITEAAARLGTKAEEFCPGQDWRNIRGLGNVLRHAYDRIDPEDFWSIVKNDLPSLKQEVDRALIQPGE